MSGAKLLSLSNLSVWYTVNHPVLSGFSLDLGTNEVVGLIGLNGAGKTTLIREITAATYAPLKEDGTVSKGMIPKIENALKAIEKGVRSVTIKHSDNLLNDTGTVIRNS